MAGRFRSGANSETLAALDKLREEVAAQQSQIAVQSARIGDLQATAKQQDARIGDLTQQLQELEAQAQWQRPAPARPQQQLFATLERLVSLVVQNQNDLIHQLRLALQSLSEQDEDTQPIEALLEDTDSQPAANASDNHAPADDSADAADASLDDVYTPVEIKDQSDKLPGAPIPLRAAASEQLKVMRVFISAEQRFVDYIGEDLPKATVNRLEAQGKLERHRFHPYKLRPTALGRKWFEQASAPPAEPDEAAAPASNDSAPQSPTPPDDHIPSMQLVVGEPNGESGRSLTLRIQRETPPRVLEPLALDDTQPTDSLDLPPLDAVVGAPGSDSARLLTLLMGKDWRASEAALQAAFPRTVFVSAIIEDINERAWSALDDNLISEDAGVYSVDSDFREAVAASLPAEVSV